PSPAPQQRQDRLHSLGLCPCLERLNLRSPTADLRFERRPLRVDQVACPLPAPALVQRVREARSRQEQIRLLDESESPVPRAARRVAEVVAALENVDAVTSQLVECRGHQRRGDATPLPVAVYHQ